jgi:hypothetical protein
VRTSLHSPCVPPASVFVSHRVTACSLAVFKVKDKEVFTRNAIGEGSIDLIEIAAEAGSKISKTVALESDAYVGVEGETCAVEVKLEWKRDQVPGMVSTDEPAVQLHIGTTILKPVEDRLPGKLPDEYSQPGRRASRTNKRECSMLDPFSWSDFLCAGSRS